MHFSNFYLLQQPRWIQEHTLLHLLLIASSSHPHEINSCFSPLTNRSAASTNRSDFGWVILFSFPSAFASDSFAQGRKLSVKSNLIEAARKQCIKSDLWLQRRRSEPASSWESHQLRAHERALNSFMSYFGSLSSRKNPNTLLSLAFMCFLISPAGNDALRPS